MDFYRGNDVKIGRGGYAPVQHRGQRVWATAFRRAPEVVAAIQPCVCAVCAAGPAAPAVSEIGVEFLGWGLPLYAELEDFTQEEQVALLKTLEEEN